MTDLNKSLELAQVAARAAAQKLATDIVAIDVHEQTIISDVFVIASADNVQQVRAIVKNVDEALSRQGADPNHIEGADECQWVLMQAPGIIVHIFLDEQRQYYDLERLWRESPEIELPDFAHMTAAELSGDAEDNSPSNEQKETDVPQVRIFGLD